MNLKGTNPKDIKTILFKALKGVDIEELKMESELVEVPSDGMYRKHVATGRRFLSITVMTRKRK